VPLNQTARSRETFCKGRENLSQPRHLPDLPDSEIKALSTATDTAVLLIDHQPQ